jgi:YegS/Rv2252/BmrU family lipid kinase
MYYYIINPSSGGGRINKIQDKLKDRLKELGIAGEFAKSTGVGDVNRLAKIAIEKGYKTIVAVGGDGTINEVINALSNTDIALGIIPIGNNNELANMLGIGDWTSACNILAARKVENIDLGKINDRVFITAVSLGFDNEISELKKNLKPSTFNKINFVTKAATKAKTYKPIHLELNFDNNKYAVETDCFNLSISNSAFLSYLPQKSRPQDNMLDAVLITQLRFKDILSYAQGTLDISKKPGQVSLFHTKKVTIKTKNPIPVSADGKVITETPVTIEVSDRKLKVIVSRKRHF